MLFNIKIMEHKKLLYMACVSDAWCTTESCVPLSKQAYFDKERAILEAVEDAKEHGRPMSDDDISMLKEKLRNFINLKATY